MSVKSSGQPLDCPRRNERFRHSSEVDLPESQAQRTQSKRRHSSLFALACFFFLIPPARAGFIGHYSLANFTLTKSDSVGGLSGTDGFAMSPDGGLSIILTGGNSGSGLAGMTDLVIHAAASGLVQFQYSYSTLDSPGNDFAGYLLADNFVQLSGADGDCNGGPCPEMVEFAVSLGQVFGFRVETVDNQGEPGILTISDFRPPSDTAEIPEPGTAPVMLVLFTAALTARWWTSKRTNQRNA